MAVHCTRYPFSTPGRPVRATRHGITLDKAIIWDSPGPFLGEARKRGGPAQSASAAFAHGGTVVGELMRDCQDRPRDQLFQPFDADAWEFTDMLRAADRRLGQAALSDRARELDDEHPAHQVLVRRFAPRSPS